ncbi:MAG: hypothetical protein HYY34_01135 [Chloroflexi bacterium]|nr:hypothetical protein [Chloroflexota bacterium]
MESAFEKLTEAVGQAIADGRVGVPSVVRWYVRTKPAKGGAAPTAESMLDAAGAWLGGKPVAVQRFGKDEAQVVLHAKWAAGAAAMLTAASGRGEPANDLIVLGSRGSIYFGRTPEVANGT